MKTVARRCVGAVLALFLIVFLCSCTPPPPAPGEPPPPEETTALQIVRFAQAIGDAYLRLEGTRFIRDRSESAFKLLDTNQDQQIELAEVLSLRFDTVPDLMVLYLLFDELRKQRDR
jgi:hypothetical protein